MNKPYQAMYVAGDEETVKDFTTFDEARCWIEREAVDGQTWQITAKRNGKILASGGDYATA
jgi:hypothetical protein